MIRQLGTIARLEAIPTVPKVVFLSTLIGVLAGLGAALFTLLIDSVADWSVLNCVSQLADGGANSALWRGLLVACPAIGLVIVAWLTRPFAPEAQGHGVPGVIVAVARHDGQIRSRVALAKILTSGICIGAGGSGDIFAPSLFTGAATGGSFGLLCNAAIPSWSAHHEKACATGTRHGNIAGRGVRRRLETPHRPAAARRCDALLSSGTAATTASKVAVIVKSSQVALI